MQIYPFDRATARAIAERQRTNIETGQAAFWRGGEWHESGSDAGMTVVTIEAETLDPKISMSVHKFR